MESILKKIFDALEDEKTEVYFQGKHKGECLKRYNVIKLGGSDIEPMITSERPIYIIMCYVPESRYTELETFIFETKQKLKTLYPQIEYDGMETPAFYDEEANAYRVSFQYVGIRKVGFWDEKRMKGDF